MTRPSFIDLFSGAGGLSSGMVAGGLDLLAAVDSVAVFCRTHEENFPHSKTIKADLSRLRPDEFAELSGVRKGKFEVLVGGPPCQTFSTIGIPKIRSLREDVTTDPRNYLFRSFFEYVDFYQPAVFLMENVPTMQTRYHGKLFERVLELVREHKYEPNVAVLNSVEFGVPQTRNRVFIVGTKAGIRFAFPRPTHEAPKNGNGRQLDLIRHDTKPLQPARTVYDALGDLPKVYDGCREDELPYSRTENLSEYQILLRNKSGLVRNNICRVSNERAKRVFAHMKQGAKYMDLPPHVRRILPFREDIFFDRLKRLDLTKPSWTVLAHIGMDGYMYIHPTEDRTLSVREAARIQGFSDSFVFTGNMREQYVQVGNAVPPLLAEALARSVRKALG